MNQEDDYGIEHFRTAMEEFQAGRLGSADRRVRSDHPVRKIISGGQTGADRAGLVAALNLGVAVGGTVPKGRSTDTGPLSDYEMGRFGLVESKYASFPPRTRANVKEADGTVIFGNTRSPGSRLTLRLCDDYNKPHLVNPEPITLRQWAKQWDIKVLNVAGNRERTNPGIYRRTLAVLVEALGAPVD